MVGETAEKIKNNGNICTQMPALRPTIVDSGITSRTKVWQYSNDGENTCTEICRYLPGKRHVSGNRSHWKFVF